MFYYNIAQFIRRIFSIQGRTRFWDTKSLFVLIIGYVVGNLLSEFYSEYSYTSQFGSRRTTNFVSNQRVHNSFTYSNLIANNMKKTVKVLCWVMTTPANHQTKAIYVLRTWGKRCNKIMLMSSSEDVKIPEIVALDVHEGKNYSWAKTKAAFTYIYNFYFDEYDWFFKADDDTYVVVENLRLFLNDFDPNTPIYFGYKFAQFVKQGYMSGGAGYVLSKEALRRFIEISIPDPYLCLPNKRSEEDVEMGICLENVGVIAGDSRDKNKRDRFLVFSVEYHLLSDGYDPNSWYSNYMYYKTQDGLNCCSDYAISFHYVQPKDMIVLDYLIYHTKPMVFPKSYIFHESDSYKLLNGSIT